MALAGSGRPYLVAAGLLAGLGASVGTSGRVALGDRPGPGARLIPAPSPCPGGGLPGGTLSYATGVALAAAALAGWRAGTRVEVSELGVAVEVWLPEVMAASYGSPTAMRPRPPVPAPGGGWLNLDLGAAGDPEAYERLLGTLPTGACAAAVAAAAQEWRLPVCDYRPAPDGPAGPPIRYGRPPTRSGRPVTGARRPGRRLVVCDLTTMWAGPLATRLLQDLGATIRKVEPAFRPDGTRAVGGGGIHPGGQQVDPGRDSAMWNALNAGKRHLDLDLRRPEDTERFVELASGCDVVIDSFSPRVMPNFGIAERLQGDPLLVSMPAFPPGPQRDWVAYGTGVHASLGLGDAGGGSFWAPSVSYPDPVAGFTGALAVLAGVVGRERGVAFQRIEATLAGAVRPLAAGSGGSGPGGSGPGSGAGGPGGGGPGGGGPGGSGPGGQRRPGPAGAAGAEAGEALLQMAVAAGLMVSRPVAGRDLLHPVGPFRLAGTAAGSTRASAAPAPPPRRT